LRNLQYYIQVPLPPDGNGIRFALGLFRWLSSDFGGMNYNSAAPVVLGYLYIMSEPVFDAFFRSCSNFILFQNLTNYNILFRGKRGIINYKSWTLYKFKPMMSNSNRSPGDNDKAKRSGIVYCNCRENRRLQDNKVLREGGI
jgi:hypothetical protein